METQEQENYARSVKIWPVILQKLCYNPTNKGVQRKRIPSKPTQMSRSIDAVKRKRDFYNAAWCLRVYHVISGESLGQHWADLFSKYFEGFIILIHGKVNVLRPQNFQPGEKTSYTVAKWFILVISLEIIISVIFPARWPSPVKVRALCQNFL